MSTQRRLLQMAISAWIALFLIGCSALTTVPTPPPHTSQSGIPELQPTTDSPKALIEYRNSEVGFSFSLPASWEGFSIQHSIWEGATSGEQGDIIMEQGPLISISHPESTAQQPRQEIPIMVFTIAQWEQMQQGEWHIGAAPFNPSELGRNSLYVLALPARYNYAFPEGWEEVEQILQNHPVTPFEPGCTPMDEP